MGSGCWGVVVMAMRLFGELRSEPVPVEGSQPGIEDQAGTDGGRHQAGQRAYRMVPMADSRRVMQGVGFSLC